MLAFTFDAGDEYILGIGLTSEDMQGLKEGKPILKNIGDYTNKKISRILFHYGESEWAIINDFKKQDIPINRLHPEGFMA